MFISNNLSDMQEQICTAVLDALHLVGHWLVRLCVNCMTLILLALLQVSDHQSHIAVYQL